MTGQKDQNLEEGLQRCLSLDIAIPELTIRRAIAWAQVDAEREPLCRRVSDSHWEVEFPEGHDPSDVQKFLKALNEFRIRELIDDKTGQLRQRIVHSALQAIWNTSEK